ncbi:hypothetical protein DMA11_07515 [Marinilabiliaceae bacterium JC017]|nr:hypothetical protein DMA11_07515 [Marinilabiliaceae bacterium JC017]
MKLKVVILLLFALLALNIRAQNQNCFITYNAQSESLANVLTHIANEYHLKFAYDAALLSQSTVNINVKKVSVPLFLNTILEGNNLCYRLIAGTYTILPCDTQEENKIKTIKGVIMDKETGETLPYTNIQINDDTWNTSNHLGIFTNKINTKDSVRIRLSYLGYTPMDTSFYLPPSSDIITFALSRTSEIIQPVAILASKIAIVEKGSSGDQLVFNPHQATYLPNIGEQDILGAISILPGINNIKESSRSLSIRGSSPYSNLILLDGFPVFNLDHFFGNFSAINPKYIKNVKISRGGFGANYGGSIAGIIDITGKTGNRHKTTVDITANLLSLNALIGAPISPKFTWIISARRSYTDVAETYLYKNLFDRNGKGFINESLGTSPDDYYDIIPHFNFCDYHSKLTYHPSVNETMSLNFYHSNDHLKYNIREDNQDYLYRINNQDQWHNNGLSYEWTKHYSSRFDSRLNVGLSRYTNESNFSNYWENINELTDLISNIQINITNRVEGLYINQESNYFISEKSSFDFGLNFNNYRINYAYNEKDKYDPSSLIGESINEKGNTCALFGACNIQPLQNIKLTAGIRSTYYSPLQKLYLEPRLAGSYKLKPGIKLHAEAGRYFQFLSTTTQYNELGNATDYWVFGHDGIHPAESRQYQGGIDYHRKSLLINMELYYRKSEGLSTSYFYATEKEGSNGATITYFTGSQVAKGLDVLIKKSFYQYTSIISYSYSQVHNRYVGINNGHDFPSNYDQPHQLKVSGIYCYKKWHFSYIWSFLSGHPYIDFTQKDYLLTPNQKRMKAIHQMDLAGIYNFGSCHWKGQLGLTLINVYNQKNIVRKKFYNTPMEENNITTANITSLSFTPVLFINIKF